MFKLVVRIATIALALVGLGTVIGWVWRTGREAPSAPNNLTFVTSPDGAFKAALASWNGGGSISPFCHDRVLVVPQATETNHVVDEDNVVFEGDCGSLTLKNGQVLNSPELSWREPKVLTIRFSTNATAARPATFHLRRLVAKGQIAVEFEFDH